MRVCGVYFVFVILLSACTNGVSHLDIALQQAKHNKAELEKVLKHFKHDSLKYRAACFLIENMPGKYSILPYDSLDRYKNFLKIIPQNDPISWDVRYSKIWHGFDSISKRQLAGFSKIEDIKVITGDYLIKNIEYSFKIWENGKIKDYCSFDEFCHYILPYRIDHEPLSDWREEGFQKFGHLLDSLMSPRELALRIIKLGGMRYNIGMTKYPYKQSYAEMLQTRWGTCDDMAAFLALSLRAIGIPASIDYVPAWANRSSSHCWNVVKDATGDFIEVGYGSAAQKAAAVDDLTGLMNFKSFQKEVGEQLDTMDEKDSGILIMIDGDHFKRVNDNYGHSVGDEVIRLSAQMIIGRIRTVDLASRLHGDEFAIFVSNTDNYDVARTIMEDINASIAKEAGKRNMPAITLSAGAVTARRGGRYTELFKAADEALYQAKKTHNGGFASFEEL